ncbi:MAG: hypothetical protein HQL21_04410 [Candidatus Omnitrophica bacterium]|nr:hypothetical protein [Candidatus Omnitrophota bacterium]
MLKNIRKFKGQSTLEYAILVVVVIAALLSLQTYIKRGIQGRLRKSSDDIGDQFSVTSDASYTRTSESTSKTKETNDQGKVETKKTGEISSNSTDKVKLGSASGEF